MKLQKRGGTYHVDLRTEGLGRYNTQQVDRKAAMQWALAKVRQEVGPESTSHTMSEAIKEAWRLHYVDLTKGTRTHRSQLKLLEEELGSVVLTALDSRAIREYAQGLVAGGLTGTTVNRRLAYVSKVLRLASGWLYNLSGSPQHAFASSLFRFLLYTGARVGEALAITEAERRVFLRTGVWSLSDSKNGKPRDVPLGETAKQALQEGWLVDGKVPCYKRVHRAWQFARREMGLQGDAGFTIHCLRHTCASRMVQAGVDLLVAGEILGHSHSHMTERYARLDVSNKRAALAAIDSATSDTTTDHGRNH